MDDTFIRTVGTGKSVLVFHGGPGFDHGYMFPHLSALASCRRLIFFDQFGIGKTPRPESALTFQAICSHAAQVISKFQTNNSISVVAHSFGVAVLLGALSILPQIKIRGLLLNAVPTNKSRFDLMRMALFSKMGPQVAESLADTSLSIIPPDQLSFLLQFYISPNSKPDLGNLKFDFSYYTHVYNSLENYDISDHLCCLCDCDLVLGDDDFIDPQLINDVSKACRSTASFASAGHFTFAEQPEQFLQKAFSVLSMD